MNKDELRIRIIPEDGEILIETHTDGIVKCKAVQEDAFLDCIKISAMQDYVNSGLLPPDCIHVKVQTETRRIVSGTRVYMQISATMRRRI